MARSTPHRLPPPRTESLVKVYLGLLAAALLLCGILAHRHIAALFHGNDVVQIPAEQHESGPPRYYGPTINWGGSRR
jgi:hypothetical protein